MKYAIAFIATILFALTNLGAQNFAFLWKTAPDDSFPVLNPKAKVGISEFGAAYAQAHDYYELAREIGEALKAGQPRTDITFVLDKPHGYLSLSHNESSFIREAEMCYWNLPDKTKLFCVKFKDVNEEEEPVFLIVFYEYNPYSGRFDSIDVEGRAEMMDNLDLWEGNENLFLPRIGKDIKWGRNNDGEAIGWYRYKGLEGFKLERVETK